MEYIVYSLSQRERGKQTMEYIVYSLSQRERVRVRVKIRSEARFRLKSPPFSLRLTGGLGFSTTVISPSCSPVL
jgi:hypothetical protein